MSSVFGVRRAARRRATVSTPIVSAATTRAKLQTVTPIRAPVAQLDQCGGVDRVQQLARFLGRQHPLLPRSDALGARAQNLPGWSPESRRSSGSRKASDGGQVLLDRGIRCLSGRAS